MKKNLFIPLVALILLAGCDYNDKYFDGLDESSRPTDVKKVEYTLTDDDYATIASNATNKALAKSRGEADVKALADLKTTKTFTSTITSIDYLPAFIAAKWYTADDKSVVKITCNEEGSNASLSESVVKFSEGSFYTVSAADYKTVWGKDDINLFAPSKPASDYLPEILAKKYPTAEQGALAYVSYNVSQREPAEVAFAYKEDFQNVLNNDPIIPDWNNIVVKGTKQWTGYAFGENVYINVSAYKHPTDLDVYLVSQKIEIKDNMQLTFDALYANYVTTGGTVSVFVYTDLEDVSAESLAIAHRDELTSQFIILTSSDSKGDLKNVGAVDLSTNYEGKQVRIAFRYVGNGTNLATSTIRIDNVAIKTPGKNEFSIVNSLYTFNGKTWDIYAGKEISVLSQSDFVRMGLKDDFFSSTVKSDTYLPTYMALTYPYAQKDDIKQVAYKYNNGAATTIQVSEYKCGEGKVWSKTSNVVTNQFKRSKGEWKYSPDVTIELLPVKNRPDISQYYQAIVDYVGADPTKGTDYYQTGYSNAEFYYGASSYQNNMSFNISSWKGSCVAGPKAYGSMSDDELKALMRKRLPEAFIPALEKYHPDADLLPSGAELNYIINFAIYEGTNVTKCTHTIAYKVIAKGKFEYVPDSFQPIQ